MRRAHKRKEKIKTCLFTVDLKLFAHNLTHFSLKQTHYLKINHGSTDRTM